MQLWRNRRCAESACCNPISCYYNSIVPQLGFAPICGAIANIVETTLKQGWIMTRKKKKMSPKERNERGKKYVAKRIREKTRLGEDTLKIWSSATQSTPDLLLTSADGRKKVLLHIQYSRTYQQDNLCRTSGWHGVAHHILETTNANYWVFVCVPSRGKPTAADCDYVIIEPAELRNRLKAYCGDKKKYHIYLQTFGRTVMDVRGATPEEMQKVPKDIDACRNYTKYLDNWKSLKAILGE